MGDLRSHLRRFWFRFEPSDTDLFIGRAFGCGVTAVDRRDAEDLMRVQAFRGTLPQVVEVIEDVDVRDLDESHVIPNMGDPSIRGVWFPRSTR
jgi:hypothetical protein